MTELTFITSHPQKAAELALHLDYPVTHYKLGLPEIQSLDPVEIVTAKAKVAFDRLKRPVLVEDFSLRFDALGGLPGPLIKWFLQELQPKGLCRLLDAYPSRRAQVQTCFALCDDGKIAVFDGMLEGSIAQSPRGNKGFGTDAIFIPDGWDITWGEMTQDEQAATSVRRIGLQKLQSHLRHS